MWLSYPATYVANNFIQLGFNEDIPITPMKLQKLVYFTHGYFLALHNQTLIQGSIKAWDYGPIIPVLYQEFKQYGNRPIDDFSYDIDCSQKTLVHFFVPENDVQASSMIHQIWDLYKGYSGIQLSNSTHLDGTPWHKTYNKMPYSRGRVIPDGLIKAYFREYLTDLF